MNTKIITEFSKRWKSLFKKIIDLSAKTLFVQRLSKLDGDSLIKSAIQAQLTYGIPSLKDYSRSFNEITGKEISASGFDYRITKKAIYFLEEFLKLLLSFSFKTIKIVPKLLKDFSEVYLLDSTNTELPSKLKDSYKGSGGCASKAGMKIQCLFSFFKMNYEHFKIGGSASEPDNKVGSSIIKLLKPGSLILFDLGYVTCNFITELIQAGMYFVSRFPYYNFTVYNFHNSKEKLDLLKILKSNKNNIVEVVGLWSHMKIPVRIIAFPMKKSVAQKRKSDYTKKRNKKGNTLKQTNLEYLDWAIYYTNASEKFVKTKNIYRIYRLRWRIELIFKLWKSMLEVSDLSGFRKERIDFEILIKLITLTFYSLFTVPVINSWSDEDVELSELGCIKLLGVVSKEILMKINKPKAIFHQTIKYSELIKKHGLKSKSRNKKSTVDLLKQDAKGGWAVFKVNDIDICLICSQYQKKHPPD